MSDPLLDAYERVRLSFEGARAALEDILSGGILTAPVPRVPNDRTNPTAVPEYRGIYRSHRPGPTPRGHDDGTNPLLQRSDRSRLEDALNAPTPFMRRETLFDMMGRPNPFGDGGPAAMLNELLTQLPLPAGALPIGRHGAALHFHVTGGPHAGDAAREFQAMFGIRPGLTRVSDRTQPTEPGQAAFFTPQMTTTRWSEEAKILFGARHAEMAMKVVTGVMAVLVPPALEAYKKEVQDKREAEEKKRRDEEERAAKAAKEAEEKAAEEQKKAEEREEAERIRAEEAAAAAPVQEGEPEAAAQPMEGVETAQPEAPAGEEAAAEVRPRITIPFRDSTLDITELGIDLDYLDALPEELREEVITGAIAQRRSEAVATGAQPSEIDQEFLAALPDEIRAEIIQQERADRRRRERDEARRQAAATGAPVPVPQDMDAASILATLPPDLRAQVLAEQDEDVLAQLPPEYIAQARASMGLVRAMDGARPGRTAGQEIVKPVRRSIVQMLDKPGVATLLRLMFVFQQDSLRNTLYQVLQNISENRHNRGEVISTLLHILQDGSADMTAVERSFAHLSLRAKQPKEKEPKTPLTISRKNTGTGLGPLASVANTEISPLMVVQQCLGALIWLCKVNPHIPSFFLSEHENAASGLKRSASRKAKGKENKAAKYPLNSLLTLLDRKLIMESSPVMESLSDLLSRITSPLQTLERKHKEAEEALKKAKEAKPEGEAAETATTEQPAEPMDTENSAPAATEAVSSTADAEAPRTDADKTEKAKEPEQKKLKPFVPPVVPDANLKLVINIFVARECSAKTFRETLSTIKNLSCLPAAKTVFGKELIRKAQELGEVILVDLEELLPQIQKASTSTELQGVALTKFSPSGSDQNKLLRVLTALDHLFAPKHAKKDTEGDEGETDTEKQDLLATLYENSTFGPMWEKLSACLSAIRQRDHVLNVATILLPLIESLMVVCKNTTLKEPAPRIGKEMALTSPVPESRMENLFYSFTEEHRKILNDLVRNTPKLMSGTFSLLVKNPKVLEFDNKRNYFTRSIHNRNNPARQSYPPLQLSVRRNQVFHDSFKSLYFKSGDEMKFGKLSIRFHGEEGVDAGGVTREWFQVLSRQMFDPGYALFIPVSSDRTTFHPNLTSSINEEHLMFFKFIGRVIGKALYEGRVLDCHFSRAVYKCILGKSVSVKDMESLDPEYYKSVIWMLENDITDIISETFSVDNDKFGVVETVDLIPNGRNIPVTEENKHEYVRLMVEFKLTGSVKEQLDNFLKGKSHCHLFFAYY
jgi:E3 ubiquitin-protein ligase HUWE1